MELPFAISLFVVALALTYFFCIRPMRRGQGHCGGSVLAGSTRKGAEDPAAARQRAEIASLREEIQSLKAARR